MWWTTGGWGRFETVASPSSALPYFWTLRLVSLSLGEPLLVPPEKILGLEQSYDKILFYRNTHCTIIEVAEVCEWYLPESGVCVHLSTTRRLEDVHTSTVRHRLTAQGPMSCYEGGRRGHHMGPHKTVCITSYLSLLPSDKIQSWNSKMKSSDFSLRKKSSTCKVVSCKTLVLWTTLP